MSQPCAVQGCKRLSCALCHCCQKNICISHLNEHHDLLKSQLNPLVDEINALGNRLQTVDIRNRTNLCRQKLERWREDGHEKINLFFQQKCQELDQIFESKIDKQQQEILLVQSKLTELLREQDATHEVISMLRSDIDNIQSEMKSLEENSVHADIQPLLIDTHSINIYESNIRSLDLSKLQPACKTIHRSERTARALTSNDKYLLFHNAPYLCLMDSNLALVKQILWHRRNILDMCWSSVLKQFIVIETGGLYTINENTMSIEDLEIKRKEKWMSCTCSDTSLFLSNRIHGSSVIEYRLLPTINFIQEWKCPISCEQTEDICSITYTNNTLALLIKNDLNKTKRMALKSSITFDCLWSLQLDTQCINKTTLRICLLTNDEWLIPDHEKSCFVHVSRDGKTKSISPYKEIPWFVNLFRSNTLVVSVQNYGLNFHRMQNDI